MECQFLEIHAPRGYDLSQNTDYASQAALWGIEVGTLLYISLKMKYYPLVGLNSGILLLSFLGFARPR